MSTVTLGAHVRRGLISSSHVQGPHISHKKAGNHVKLKKVCWSRIIDASMESLCANIKANVH